MMPPGAEPEKCPRWLQGWIHVCEFLESCGIHSWEELDKRMKKIKAEHGAAHSTPAAPAETRGTWECTCEGRNQKVWNADPNCEIHGEKSPLQPSDDVEPSYERAEFPQVGYSCPQCGFTGNKKCSHWDNHPWFVEPEPLDKLLYVAKKLLEWVPTCSEGSSGWLRIEALKAAIKSVEGQARASLERRK